MLVFTSSKSDLNASKWSSTTCEQCLVSFACIHILYGVRTWTYLYTVSVYLGICSLLSLCGCLAGVFHQNLFQPSQNQVDVKNEKQREMERTFEHLL